MKLSKPEAYIDILLNDFTSTIKKATARYYQAIYSNYMHKEDAYFELEKELNRIEEIKKEIIEICLNN